MIDQNHDGFIDQQDLREVFQSLGKEVNDDFLEEMVSEGSGPINFTMFLTLFGEKLMGTDPEDVIILKLITYLNLSICLGDQKRIPVL